MPPQPVIVVMPSGPMPSAGKRIWGKAPGLLSHLVAKLWLLVLLYATSDVVNHSATIIILFVVAALLMIRWIVGLTLNLTGSLLGRAGGGLANRLRFSVIPLIFMLGIAAWYFRPGLYIRLLWSMGPLQAFVDFESREFAPDDAGRWVGLFEVHGVQSRGNLVCIRTTDPSEPAAGLAYITSGGAPGSGPERYQPLYGSWWAWYPDASVTIPSNVSRLGEWLGGFAPSIYPRGEE